MKKTNYDFIKGITREFNAIENDREKENKGLLKERLEKWDKIKTIRVGDYLLLKGEETLRRVAHDYGDAVQPSTGNGSLYFGDGYMEYSGGLDGLIKNENLALTDEIKEGDCWFFDKNIPGAGRGIQFTVPCRVWKEVS